MKAAIHPTLLKRLIDVQEAFNQPGFRPIIRAPARPVAQAKRGNNWNDIIKEEDKDGGDGQGGGGTMRGLRGKHAEQAKAAMRKLGRR